MVYLGVFCGILTDAEIVVDEPGHAAESFAERSSESHTAAVGERVEPAGSRAKRLRRIESP